MATTLAELSEKSALRFWRLRQSTVRGMCACSAL